MADSKITALTALSSIDDTADVVPIVDTSASATKKVTMAVLNEYFNPTPTRSALSGTEVDFTAFDGSILTKTLSGNITLTIINPLLMGIVTFEIAGNFTLTLPASVTILEGAYNGTATANYLMILCVDSTTPKYIGFINQ